MNAKHFARARSLEGQSRGFTLVESVVVVASTRPVNAPRGKTSTEKVPSFAVVTRKRD